MVIGCGLPPKRGLQLHRLKSVSPFLVVMYMAVAAVTWAAVTPPGGVPDEPSHVVYAAGVVRGDLGSPFEVDDGSGRLVPALVAPEWVTSISVCYRGKPSTDRVGSTADCQPPLSESSATIVATTTVTKYPPPYYWVVGLPSLVLSGAKGLYGMRAASILLFAAVVSVGLAIATSGRRAWLGMGLILAFTPSAAHIIGSVNPSSLEIAAAMGLCAGLLGLDEFGQSQRRVLLEALGLAILGSLLAWSRPTGPYYVIPVVVTAGLLNVRGVRAWARANPVTASVSGVVVVAASVGALVFEFAVRRPFGAALASGAESQAWYNAVPFWDNVDVVLTSWHKWVFEGIGQLGWLDHSVPGIVQLVWFSFSVSILIYAIASARQIVRILLVAVVVGATVLAPLFTLVAVFGGGLGYQARYHLPLMALIPLTSMFVLGEVTRGDVRRFLKSILGWIGGVVPSLMLISIAWSLSRYAVDARPVWSDVLRLRFVFDALWSPPPKAAAIVVLGSLLLAWSAYVLRAVGRATVESEFESTHPT